MKTHLNPKTSKQKPRKSKINLGREDKLAQFTAQNIPKLELKREKKKKYLCCFCNDRK